MTAIPHASAAFTADQTIASTTTPTVISAGNIDSTAFTAGNKYLLLWRGYVQSSSSAANNSLDLRWATSGQIQRSYMNQEGASTTDGLGWLYSGAIVVTAPDPVEDLDLYGYKGAVTGGTAVINNFSLVAIDLGALTENTDWFSAEDDDFASPVDIGNSGTVTDFVTLTQTFDSGDWLILPFAIFDQSTSSASCYIRMAWSGGGLTSDNYEWFIQEPEDGSDRTGVVLTPQVFSLDGSSATFKVQMRNKASSSLFDHLYSSVIAINLGVFEEFHSAYTDAVYTASASDTWEEAQAITPFSPSTAGDFLVIGAGLGDSQQSAQNRIQVGGTNFGSSDDENNLFVTWDARDIHQFLQLGIGSFSGSTDIDMDWYTLDTANGMQHRSLIAISMELAGAGGTPYSADLTSESFDFTSQALDYSKTYPAALTSQSFAFTSQTLNVEEVTSFELSTPSFGFTTQDLDVDMVGTWDLSTSSFGFTALDLEWISGSSQVLTTSSFGFNAQDLIRAQTFPATLSSASFGFTALDLSYEAGEIQELTTASFGISPQNLDVIEETVNTLTLATFSMSAQDINFKQDFIAEISTPSFGFTTQDIDVTQLFGAQELTLGDFKFSSNPLDITGDFTGSDTNRTDVITDVITEELTRDGVDC